MNGRRSVYVGMFVVGGLLLFVGALFLIGDRRMLFDDQFALSATFGRVTGLEVGTRVRLAGLDAGEVTDIVVPPGPAELFQIRMRVREELRNLVRTDSVAAIVTDGLVGNAFIQLSVGSDTAPVVSDNDIISGRDPIQVSDLIDEGRATFQTVSNEIVDLTEDVSLALVALTNTIDAASTVVVDVGEEVEVMASTGNRVFAEFEGIVADARGLVERTQDGEGTIGRFLTDDTLFDQFTAIGEESVATMRNIRETTERAAAAVDDFTARDGTVQQISQTLRNTLAEIEEVTSDLADGTEAMKRNFLFRGFFQDRGFFDLDTVSLEAYQAGILERDNRTAVRIWIGAEGIFERDAAGRDRLTDEGRLRLDSAMADLVRYPRDSPLVIEGYAESLAGETAYLTSVDRAQLVYDYLSSRFRLQSTLTGIMPLGDRALGSPRGDDTWSGIALTVFVSNVALTEARGETQ